MNNGGSFHGFWYVYQRVSSFCWRLGQPANPLFSGKRVNIQHRGRGGISPDYMVEHPILIGGDWNMIGGLDMG